MCDVWLRKYDQNDFLIGMIFSMIVTIWIEFQRVFSPSSLWRELLHFLYFKSYLTQLHSRNVDCIICSFRHYLAIWKFNIKTPVEPLFKNMTQSQYFFDEWSCKWNMLQRFWSHLVSVFFKFSRFLKMKIGFTLVVHFKNVT